MQFRPLHLLLFAASSLLLVKAATADDWHANDETFDPSVEFVVVDNASRLGDPTPFHKDGNPTRSFTVIDAKSDDKGGATIHFSLIVPFVPGQSATPEGGALFMTIEQTETLIGYLKTALEAPSKAAPVGKVFGDDYYQQYTVLVDPNDVGPVVLKHEMNGAVAQFRFAESPTKKLIDTLEHFLAEARKIADAE